MVRSMSGGSRSSRPGLPNDNPLCRDQDRVMRTDAAMALDLYERLRAHLPARMGELKLYRHEGQQVIRRTKYAMRTDTLYGASDLIATKPG
jgi:hypothetical protein